MTETIHQDRPNDFYALLKGCASRIEERYRALTPASSRLFEDAKGVLPDGYTRDAVIRDPHPIFVGGGEGAVLTDADGRKIVDMCFNATSLPLGHADPRVVSAVCEQVRVGSAFQAMTGKEVELANLLCARLPSAERVRFANSGSEAVMMALRIARAFTGRNLVIKFEGSYHGTYDDVQWSVSPSREKLKAAGTQPVPGSAGLPGDAGRVMVLPYNDPDTLRIAMTEHGDRVAAIIAEPMANRIGLVVPQPEFLRAARQCCDDHGAVLIFDEVIAFRLGFNGAQGALGIIPDLTVLGKSIGGGHPVGGIAGPTELLAFTQIGHASRVTHPGTFNGNPVTMAAGTATLEALTPDVHEVLNETAEGVRQRLRDICEGVPLRITGVGPFFKINATATEISDYRDAVTVDKEWERLASLALLNEGFMLTPTLRGCVSTATTGGQISDFLDAFANVVNA